LPRKSHSEHTIIQSNIITVSTPFIFVVV